MTPSGICVPTDYGGDALHGPIPAGHTDPLALILLRILQNGAGAANFFDIARDNISQCRNDLWKGVPR